MKGDLNPRDLKFTLPIRWTSEIEQDSSDSSDDDEGIKDNDTIFLDGSDSCDVDSIVVEPSTLSKAEPPVELLRMEANDGLFDSSSYEPISDDDEDDTDEERLGNSYKWCVCDSGSKPDSNSKMCIKCQHWYHLTCLPSSYRGDDKHSQKRSDQFDLVCPVCNKDDPFIQKHRSKINIRNSKYNQVLSERSYTERSDTENTNTNAKLTNSSDSENIVEIAPVVRTNPRDLTEEETRKKINILKKSNTNVVKSISLIDPSATRPKKSRSSHQHLDRNQKDHLQVMQMIMGRPQSPQPSHKPTVTVKKIQPPKKDVTKRWVNRHQMEDCTVFTSKIQSALQSRYDKMDAELKAKHKIVKVNIEEISDSIAEEAYNQLDRQQSQKQIIRLLKNIRQNNNTTFYLKILTGQIKPKELPAMSNEDMASEEMKASFKEQRDKDIQARIELSNEWNAERAKPHFKKTKKGEEYLEADTNLASISILEPKSCSTSKSPSNSSSPSEYESCHSSPIETKNTTVKASVASIPEPILPANHQLQKQSQQQQSPAAKQPVSATFMSSEFNQGRRLSAINTDATTKIINKVKSPKTTEHPKNPAKSPNINLNDIQAPQIDTSENNRFVQSLKPNVNSWQTKLLVRFNQKKKEYHVSTKAHLIPMVNPAEEVNHNIIRQLDHFPKELVFNRHHFFTNKASNTRNIFWDYLTHFHNKKPSSLVFLRFEYGEESHSKQIHLSGDKREEEVRTDKGVYLDVCEGMEDNLVFEANVPKALKQTFGKLYMWFLKKPTSASENPLEPCKSMRNKYSIEISRNQNQLCSVLIDDKAIKEFYEDFHRSDFPCVWRYTKQPSSKRSPDHVSPNDAGPGGKDQAAKQSFNVSGSLDEPRHNPKKRLDPRLHRMNSEQLGNNSGSETEAYEAVIERELAKPVVDPKMARVEQALEKIVQSSDYGLSVEQDLAKRMLNSSPPDQIAKVINRVVQTNPKSYEKCLEQELAKEAKRKIAQEADTSAQIITNFGTSFPASCLGESREAFMNLVQLSRKGKRPFEDQSMENDNWALDNWYKDYNGDEPAAVNVCKRERNFV